MRTPSCHLPGRSLVQVPALSGRQRFELVRAGATLVDVVGSKAVNTTVQAANICNTQTFTGSAHMLISTCEATVPFFLLRLLPLFLRPFVCGVGSQNGRWVCQRGRFTTRATIKTYPSIEAWRSQLALQVIRRQRRARQSWDTNPTCMLWTDSVQVVHKGIPRSDNEHSPVPNKLACVSTHCLQGAPKKKRQGETFDGGKGDH
jgi:hypothetical protein